MSQPVMTLEYAKAQSLGGPEARRAFRLLLMVAILSGLCVGVCFLAMAAGAIGAGIHVIVFAATIFIAIKASKAMMQVVGNHQPFNSAQFVLDLLAAQGLVLIGIAPLVNLLFEARGMRLDDNVGAFAAGAGALAYGLLAGTTFRHLLFYRMLGDYCRQNNQYRIAKACIVLGWVKMIYEGIWLTLCTLALVSISIRSAGSHSAGAFEAAGIVCLFGAFFGAIGFSVIWLWMIIVHANLMRLTAAR